MTQGNPPRLLLAAANSGAGKTTATCALLQAFADRGERLASFKCGPDYIDPMFHSEVIGAKSRNLDLFFYGEDTARFLLCKNSAGCTLSILEGVMGFYDGVGGTSTRASSYDLASVTRTPVVLVVNARGLSLSAAALVKGFAGFRPDSNVCAVLLNRCSPMTYPMLKQAIERETGIPVAGYLPEMADCSLESRHLGLITAAEVQNLREKLQTLARQAERSVDLGLLLRLAHSAPELEFSPPPLPAGLPGKGVRIAVAQDRAFCFYYEDSLDLLRELGAELIPFSPLADAAIPAETDGLLLGGGYPEVYAKALSQNREMLQSIREAVAGGLPTIAECGGFLYLHREMEGEDGVDYPMVGVIDARCWNARKLCRFGYAELTAQSDGLLCRRGERFHAHEFHYWDSEQNGDCFEAVKASGRRWRCVHSTPALYAGFPHLHFYSNPGMAVRYLEQCQLYRKGYDRP